MHHCLLFVAMISVQVGLFLLGEQANSQLAYQREAIFNGEIWRLFTGHLVHLGAAHLWLNLLGLSLSWMLVRQQFSVRQWLLLLLLLPCLISISLMVFDSQLESYMGFSGVIHGMIFAGAVRGMNHLDGQLLLLTLCLKLAYEQLAGPLVSSEELINAAVIVDAHLYGVLAAIVVLLIFSTNSKWIKRYTVKRVHHYKGI